MYIVYIIQFKHLNILKYVVKKRNKTQILEQKSIFKVMSEREKLYLF